MDTPWFLRITALFLAIILFFSVQAEEKLKSKSTGDQLDIIHEVPVEVYYDDENLVVTGVPETVNITIDGPTNIVQTTKMLKDFTVFVDLRTLTIGEHHVQIKHENISDKLQVRLDPTMINVVIEEKITESFRVDPEMNKRLIAEDYKIASMSVEPSTVEITGARSIIESISYVKATVTGELGIKESFEQEASVRVLDRDLNKLNVTVVPESVIVKVEVVENSKEVPIVLRQKGTASEGVTIDTIESEPSTMTLFGPSKVLEEINEIEVEVDIAKVTKSTALTVDVKKPRGVSELSNPKITVNVKATSPESKAEEEKTEISVGDEDKPVVGTKKFDNMQVMVNDLPQRFTSVFTNPTDGIVALTITADPTILNNLTKSHFTLSIDASDIEESGEYEYPILVRGPDNVNWTLSTQKVSVKVELA